MSTNVQTFYVVRIAKGRYVVESASEQIKIAKHPGSARWFGSVEEARAYMKDSDCVVDLVEVRIEEDVD